MKIEDKVIVTYSDDSQKVGRIVGETAKQWKILFDGESDEKRINKTMDIQLIDDPETPEPEVITIDTEKVISWIEKFYEWVKKLFKKK